MANRSRESVADLHRRWNDEADLARMSSLLDLREFLRQCVITADYAISDSLNASIALSDYGDWLQRELGKKKVPTKEARLLCFLEFFHLDLLVDIHRMDPRAVADGIGEELLKKRIYLPHVMGPGLYRKAAELFPEERYRLGNSDTLRLLDGEPVGVFQLGYWVSGPYGMLSSRAARALTPTLAVPLQHCHDVACRRIHRVYLETDQTAAINEHRAVAQKILDNESAESSDYSIFFGDVFREEELTFDDFNLGTLPLLLGDCLADGELRALLAHLVESDSSFRAVIAEQGFKRSGSNLC